MLSLLSGKWRVVTVLALAVVIILLLGDRLRCRPGDEGFIVHAPPDSSYMPVLRRQYSPPPPLIGGLTTRRSAAPLKKLPQGVAELDVQRVVRLRIKDSNKPVTIVELRDGSVLVERDSVVEVVEVIEYERPAVAFGLFPGIGITGTMRGGDARVVPMLKLSFAELFGRVRLPMVVADTDGIGLGVETRLYHDLFIGAGVFATYSNLAHRQLKATLEFNL